MKKSDLITVALIAIVGTIAAFFLVNSILGDPAEKRVSFKYVANEIGTLVEPDGEVFNDSAINPTVEVYVGSCVDLDQNGEISLAELVACGQAAPDEESGAEAENGAESQTDGDNEGGTVEEETEEDEIERTLRQIRGQTSTSGSE